MPSQTSIEALIDEPAKPAAPASAWQTGDPPGANGADALIMHMDFAYASGGQLLVYGWILGLSQSIHEASVSTPDWSLDLIRNSVRIPRPDVAAHFAAASQQGSEHGFYALVEGPDAKFSGRELTLRVVDRAGRPLQRVCPITEMNEQTGAGLLAAHLKTIGTLVPHLPGAEAERLVAFVAAVETRAARLIAKQELDPPTRFVVDFCCVLEERVLVAVGWMLDPFMELSGISVQFESSRFNFRDGIIGVDRPDLTQIFAPFSESGGESATGFVFAAVVPAPSAVQSTATFSILRGNQTIDVRRPSTNLPQQARTEFGALLANLDPSAVISMVDHLTSKLSEASVERSFSEGLKRRAAHAARRLPASLQNAESRYALSVDQAIPAGDQGVFVSGWYAAAAVSEANTVWCHAGDTTFDMSANWSRYPRPDVAEHLAQSGIAATGRDNGFLCFVPLGAAREAAFLSVREDSGQRRRVRLVPSKPRDSALEDIRPILSIINHRHPALYETMDHHVGPAVSAIWSARHKPPLRPRIERYGPVPVSPEITLIIPLYGRHDFVEYHLALFADDPDFRRIELMYVVDDPSLYQEFSALCDGFLNMYGIPFTVVYPGVNLGFAGANNCGAAIARGSHLLLMNSDVLPRRNGWASEMMDVYLRTSRVGILGVKLLYENGGVQHAGMEFRRSPLWGNMWINYHSHKGQSPLGLTGVRPAEAVTAACILVETALYRSLGGLSEDYIIGDFEDSDLCLRAAAAGRPTHIALDIELNHLERQSQNRIGDGSFRANLSIYNCWLHHRRWSASIERMKR